MYKPIPIYQIAILLILGAAILVVASKVVSYHSYNPVVLNSLPATKIKCDTSAIPGYCAGKGIYENKWMEAQE